MLPRYLVVPPTELYLQGTSEYLPGHPTYSSYNYLGDSLIAQFKRRHFEVALSLTQERFKSGAAIDMGCADGFFLPSLSRYFDHVYAIDYNPAFCSHAEHVASALDLQNLSVICNRDLSWEDLAQKIPVERCSTLYLLETLEHIGVAESLYESKIAFLRDCFRLLAPAGVIVISVPTMVGIPFLLQRIVLRAFGMHREPISPRQLFRSVVLRNADELESAWTTSAHLGFNHRKLEKHLSAAFEIVAHRNLQLSQVYAIRQYTGRQ
jgi:2-polyprenyl-3-methyl-5-hydroxy-6-metoxy-1,4-benzoquinol methylase